ncbi:hypothetical protein MW871_16110 [Flavobacterium sp. I-SCBP12n]|uniref:Uncharacterized protein n=1 Tax=Flavobacterium pygoscelis TaxID=2893176 RepID=A0A9X1XUE6_9FLAO|nr:hypothetical protein [Flavobacterium pygoscelis]MCK8143417.1 hypothetical protein [Flavobacterium pygoscelis]
MKKTTLVLIVITFLFFWGCEEFLRRKVGGFAGSYPFVEYWEIKASEREVLDAIRELSKINPNFKAPNNIEFISKRDTCYIWTSDEMKEYVEKLKLDSLLPLPKKSYENYYDDYWVYVNLYYPETKEIVHTWTRPANDTTFTTFAFVSLTKIGGTETKLINRDFWYIANKLEIHKFKTKFVDKIQTQIEKKRKSGT